MVITKELIAEYRTWLLPTVTTDTVRSYSFAVQHNCIGLEVIGMNNRNWFNVFIREMREQGKSWSTVGTYVASCKKFLLFMNEVHELPYCMDIERVRVKHEKAPDPDYLEKDEIALLRSLPATDSISLRNRTLFEFLLETGCRIGEAVALNVSDLDFITGEIKVTGKGNVQRTVYFNTSKSWFLRYFEEEASQSDDPLFFSQYGTRLNRSDATIHIRNMGKRAGLKKRLYCHLLRHTFGTYCIRAGVDPKTVQRMMGHEDLETTLKYYVGVNKDQMKLAHASLSLFMAP